jgi:hypothetical protein
MKVFYKSFAIITLSILVSYSFYQCQRANGMIADETFSDNSMAWPLEQDEAKEFAIKDGYLRLKNTNGDNWFLIKPFPLDTLKDFSIETTIKHVSVNDSLMYGIMMYNENTAKEYYFLLSGKEMVVCSIPRGDLFFNYHYLEPDTVTLNTTGNTFGVERTGIQTSFFFNKKKIATLDSIPFRGTSIGYAMFRRGTLEIDNLKITQK